MDHDLPCPVDLLDHDQVLESLDQRAVRTGVLMDHHQLDDVVCGALVDRHRRQAGEAGADHVVQEARKAQIAGECVPEIDLHDRTGSVQAVDSCEVALVERLHPHGVHVRGTLLGAGPRREDDHDERGSYRADSGRPTHGGLLPVRATKTYGSCVFASWFPFLQAFARRPAKLVRQRAPTADHACPLNHDEQRVAVRAEARAVGKANFGFVSRYRKGANVPTGQTEFQFKAGGLEFHSSAYEWLVVSGARAQFKGEGAVNGQSGYGFHLTAIDAGVNTNDAHDLDRFRIEIWELGSGAVVYDNQVACSDDSLDADPCTALGGGNVIAHSR